MTLIMSKTWITEIDSDIGMLKLKIQYEYDSGSYGDYHTPGEDHSVKITDIQVTDISSISPFIVEQLEDEILDEVYSG